MAWTANKAYELSTQTNQNLCVAAQIKNSMNARWNATASQLLPTLHNLVRQAAAVYSGRESFIVYYEMI